MNLLDVCERVEELPDDSAVKRAVGGGWTNSEQLAALVADRLAVLIWQKTANGSKGRKQPKPIPRPGFEDETKQTFRGDRMTLDQAKRWAKSRRAQTE